MYLLALFGAVGLLIASVAQPERWPAQFASFLRSHHIHRS